ncbi:MAG: FAD-binding oxidoreductase [Gemmataceae bacterium]
MTSTTCQIDETGPYPVITVSSPAELGEQIQRARDASQGIYPLGGRTALDLGLPPSKPGIAVDLTRLTQVIDYPARDMTITVQAGIRMAELQQMLSKEGQRLPIDVPHADRATLGGIIATNTSGSHRFGLGTLRDYIIGITTYNDEGQETKAGGRVVKNVAGYDFCKLHTGALGTLGCISQVTLKVRPIPESQALLTFGCNGVPLERAFEELHQSRTRPTCIDLVNGAAAQWLGQRSGMKLPEQSWVVIVGFEDMEAAVSWQLQQAIRELTHLGIPGVEALAGSSAGPLWQALTDLLAPDESRLTLKAGLLPGRLAEFVRLASDGSASSLIHAHAGNGIVRMHHLQEENLAQVRPRIDRLSQAVAGMGGHLTIPRCPAAWKRELPVWGRTRPDSWLHHQVKKSLDPRGLFNPGRFVDGI